MTNEIMAAISNVLYNEFGYENHMEEIKQDLKEPCFFISSINPEFRRYLGKRYLEQNQFCIQYFPKSKDSINEECFNAAYRMNWCLEVIEIMGKQIRASGMNYKVIDEILNYFVNYDIFLDRIETHEKMDFMRSDTNVKGRW